MKNEFKDPIRYSDVNTTTLKRALLHIMIMLISAVVAFFVLNVFSLEKEFVSKHKIIIFVMLIIFLIVAWWLEFKYIWSKVTLIYSIHELEIPPITVGVLIGFIFKVFMIF